MAIPALPESPFISCEVPAISLISLSLTIKACRLGEIFVMDEMILIG